MGKARGYDEAANARIQAGIRKIERIAAALPEGSSGFNNSRAIRVALDDDMTADGVSGKVQLPKLDKTGWKTTNIPIPQIFAGTTETESLVAGDAVWIVPDAGRWYAISIAKLTGENTETVQANGCCAACIPCEWMTVDGFYAEEYESLGTWPDQLGGTDLTWSYIGLNADNNYVWQTDAFEFACDDGTDSYYLELVIYADGTSECKSEGSEVAEIYLCNDATATECEDLTAQNCTGGCADGATGGGGGALDCACPCDVWFQIATSGALTNGVYYQPGAPYGCYKLNSASDMGTATDSDGNAVHFYAEINVAAASLTINGTKDSDGSAFAIIYTAASSPLSCSAGDTTFNLTSQTGSIATQPSSITVTASTGHACP